MEKSEFDPSFFKVNWIVDLLQNEENYGFVTSDFKPTQNEKKFRAFGICSAPGKNLAKGRDGKSHQRCIKTDCKFFKEYLKVDLIVCLLDKYELRTIGCDLDLYKKACQKYGIELLVYPIVEMAAPPNKPGEFDSMVIKPILEKLVNRKRVICHCRGGIGRAGTIASCLLLKLGLVQ
mmetsp:Transcript_37903/g.33922  ORF Transcript_37903/g.33922 Transcript_37903/m.33922 type:complete len:177 (+) Transcript_37903:56-586(+)